MSISAYKGKISTLERGWSLLPAELLQYIATLSLILSNTSNLNQSTATLPWQSRIVLFALRDSCEMERIMGVCIGWKSALESHQFWQHAVGSLDPLDTLAHHAVIQQPSNNSSAKSSFLTELYVYLPTGLTVARQAYWFGPLVGPGAVCPTHESSLFCSICFRESAVSPTNDYESFPGVANVCKICRRNTRNWHELCVDEEARRAIEGFVGWGDGTARRVAEYCLDRAWLRRRTRIVEYMELVRANAEAYKPERTYDSDDELMDDSEEEDEDEEAEHDSRARGLALGAWARARVLDGFWVLPTDQWHAPMQPITLRRSRPFDSSSAPSVAHMDPPPSFALSEQANIAYCKTLGELLLPPFRNIMRKLVMQGGGPKEAQQMSIGELGMLLQEQGTWWEGWNWPTQHIATSDDGSDDSGPSTSTSASSTSPTTPSPPPIKQKEDESSDSETTLLPSSRTTVLSRHETRVEREPFIPISPVLDPPRLLRHVPWIPDNLEELSEGSRRAIMDVWRKACEPLYACECKICERNKPKPERDLHTTITLVPSQGRLEGAYTFKDDSNEEVDADGEGELEYEEDDEMYSTEGSLADYIGDVPAVGRKRSVDEVDVEIEVEGGRTPPKRQRASSYCVPADEKDHIINTSPARKRSSEEVEQLDHQLDGKRAKREVDAV
ncbi:hypothetical protein BDZ89DRAFT_1057922 [Hymenopellis radicata]|nr:hypothetical protein BDZ89DRAFT_1057922 [Hymenopellis radicata]